MPAADTCAESPEASKRSETPELLAFDKFKTSWSVVLPQRPWPAKHIASHRLRRPELGYAPHVAVLRRVAVSWANGRFRGLSCR